MRFEFESGKDSSTLRANFEFDEHQDGERQEGPGQLITYSGQEITFDYGVRSIHPDLLGLLCLIIFYPFIGQRVIFPSPVSPRLEKAFRRGPFKRQFRFDNVDRGIRKYEGSRMVLSFGGGIDSSAVRKMFPEAFVVHEAHIRNGQVVPSDAHDVVRDLGPDRGRVVTTNQRYVSHPGGWHGWTCAFATSLLMATDYRFGIILMGSNLGGTLLHKGTRYYNRFKARKWHGPTGNFWQSAFDDIGIPLFSPVSGASEYLTMALSLDLVRSGRVVYCMERDGSACHRCTKCMRRDVIRTVVDEGHHADWGRYDRKDVHEFLEREPLYQGYVFSFARDRVSTLPHFMTSRLGNLPSIELDWPMRIHPRTFRLCDKAWRPMIRRRVLGHVEPMTRRHVSEMKKWDVMRPQPSRRPWMGLGFPGSNRSGQGG